jgi:hypothetical protein
VGPLRKYVHKTRIKTLSPTTIRKTPSNRSSIRRDVSDNAPKAIIPTHTNINASVLSTDGYHFIDTMVMMVLSE